MDVYNNVRSVLEASSFNTMVTLVSKVLGQTGFGDVAPMGRLHEKEKSRFGGFDLECRYGSSDFRQLAVVKIIKKDSVHLRMLSELAGTVMLHKANFGVLVCTGKASDRMRSYLSRYGSLLIDIIDGPHLARLMHRLGIGVRPSGEIDFAYLESLNENGEALRQFVKTLKP